VPTAGQPGLEGPEADQAPRQNRQNDPQNRVDRHSGPTTQTPKSHDPDRKVAICRSSDPETLRFSRISHPGATDLASLNGRIDAR